MVSVDVTYSKTGMYFNDFEIDSFVKDIVEGKKDVSLNVSTGLVIHALRVQHAKGNINLKVFFEGKKLQINRNGKISNWPNNFLDKEEKYLVEIFKESKNNKDK